MTIAATAAILLCVTTGHAANMLFTIDSGNSSIFLEIDVEFGSGFSGGAQSYHFASIVDSEDAQFLGLLPVETNVNQFITGSFTGTATGTPGTVGSTLQLDSGANINLAENGSFWPTLGAFTKTDAQFGFDSGNLDVDPLTTTAWAALRGLTLDIGSVNVDTGDTVVDGGQLATWSGAEGIYFDTDFGDQVTALVATAGVLDILVSDKSIQHDADGIYMLVSPDGETPVLAWNGTFLVFPYGFGFSQYDPDFDVTYTYAISGQILAIAEPVPEPSSVMLLSLGAVGMLGYFWRARKRRA